MNCRVIQIETPRKFLLNGLLFGGEKPKHAIVFIHGLTASAFSNHKLVVPLANKDTVAITFSNRGSHKISKVKKIDRRKKKGYTSQLVGEAHEVFADCVDDIQGAVNFVRGQGVREVYLVGHSTGCQKSVYYLSRRGKQKQIAGLVLLCPVSDYAAIRKFESPSTLNKVEKKARELVKVGRPHEFLPLELWPHLHDAQRYLSLYTPESEEEIFSYAVPEKEPQTLQKIRTPTLVVYAGGEEYRDRPIQKIAGWFKQNAKMRDLTISVIDRAPHSFNKYEDRVVEQIRRWLKARLS